MTLSVPHLLETNLCGHVSYAARHTAGMRVTDHLDVLVVDSGLLSDTFNIVCRTRFEPGSADRRIDETVAAFSGTVPFAWWIGPTTAPADLSERLTSRGLPRTETEIGMSVGVSDLLDAPVPAGLIVRRACTLADVADYAHVLSALSDPPDSSFGAYYERAAQSILTEESPLRLYVGALDGEPVAGSEMYLEHGVAGLYGVATVPQARRLGIGSAMTTWPLRAARAEGATLVVLQAAPAGAALYARLGFQPCGEFAVHQYAPAASRAREG